MARLECNSMPLGLHLGGRTRIQEGVVFPSAATPSKQLHEGVKIAVQAPLKIFSLTWLRIFLSQGDISPSMKILGSGSSFFLEVDKIGPCEKQKITFANPQKTKKAEPIDSAFPAPLYELRLLFNSLSNDDGEDEADARRLIRVRGIDNRWRRIDRLRIVATGGRGVMRTLTVLVPVLSVPALFVIPLVLVVFFLFGERRRDG